MQTNIKIEWMNENAFRNIIFKIVVILFMPQNRLASLKFHIDTILNSGLNKNETITAKPPLQD